MGDQNAAAPGQRYEAIYAAALDRLRRAGIDVQPNGKSYADQRGQWEPLVRRVAPTLGFEMDEIDCRRSPNRAPTSDEVQTRGRQNSRS
ncbi:MAG: hypothetical protein QHC67_16595 [Sphingobium sp.]|uniref:hypothetical protein n=1 Tax=Sphingobium sp. TaxID=1912891 RepID=UPI0029A3BCA7|nr:hypothetical protein [Sphingobium sp.]MDX3911408.1 hypothetical protein [Sphingobium sp.]